MKSSRPSSAHWQVLEDEDERAPLGKRLEEAPPGGERLAALVLAQLLVRAEPDERLQPPDHPVRIPVVARAVRTLRPSLSVATCAESVSRMPACALTISLSAQYVTPSP